MVVKQIINTIHSSNTFLIFLDSDKDDEAWLIDVGDNLPIMNNLNNNTKIKGIFITHTHFDHIFGINEIIERFPDSIVYTSENGKEGLYSDKQNYSRYHETPLIFQGKNIAILTEGQKVSLNNKINVEVLETPGHDWSCLTYQIGNYLFTGDSFIPNIKVVTTLRGGNKAESKKSLEKIKAIINDETLVCAGHGPILRNSDFTL